MEILEKVKSRLPEKAVSRAELEGSEIIVYTKDREFFKKYEERVREIVEELKKRIEVRPEKEICSDQEEAIKKIREIVPEDARIKNIYFEPERSLVIIAAEKPGLVIGRGGETFRKIRSEVFWVPRIERIPPLKSEIVEGIRKVLHDEVKFRKELLNKIGETIFSERKTSRDWIRVIGLGACREVGRSAFLIETPKSKVLVDLGIKVGATSGDMFPVLQTREFDPNELDAVIISHAHLDHCLHPDSLIQLSDGSIERIEDVITGQEVPAVDFDSNLQLENIRSIQRGSIKSPEMLYDIRIKTKRLKVTVEHPFFVLSDGGIEIRKAGELREGDFLAVSSKLNIKGSAQKLPESDMKFPKELEPQMAQIIGYILGDGNKMGSSITCTDKNVGNLIHYKGLIENYGLKPKIKIKDRNRLNVHSISFREWLEKIGNILEKSPERRVPKVIKKSNNDCVAAFLKGLLDAKGCVKHHSVVFSTSSKILVHEVQLLLLRFEIISHIYDHDQSKSTFGGGEAYQLAISDPNSLKVFEKYIGFDDNRRCEKLKKMIKSVGNAMAQKMDLIPISMEYFLSIAKKLGLRKIDLRKLGFQYTHYKNHYPTRKKVKEIATKLYELCREKNIEISELEFLLKVANSEVMWEPVTKISKIKSDTKYVYDLTVPGHSNYIANGIVVHNCGLVPYLYAFGYNGPVYMTTPTLDLFAMNCLDYVDVQQKNAMQPTYTAKDVKEAVKHCITLDWGEVSDVAPDIRLTFQNAGHILGSALVHLHVGDGMHNIVYASDMKYGKTTLLDPAFTDFQRVETLIMESTYGSFQDIMPPRMEAERHLIEVVNRIMERGGQVLIPSFAIERAQEIMAILAQSDFQYPVFIDGMIMDATGIYTAYPEYMARNVQRQILSGEDPFKHSIFKRIASQDEREKSWNEKPSVIISTSGMLMGGPAVEHLKALAEDSKNSLLFVGFQAEGTMGRRIQRGWREVPLRLENGKMITINLNMEIETIEGLSGHSDRNQLLSFVSRLAARPDRIIVVHGESQKTLDLSRTIHRLFRIESTAPKVLEGIRLR